jgi:hypothetical protein
MASTVLVRIPPDSKAALEEMAAEEKLSLPEMLSRIIEQARRQRIIDSTNRFYAGLRADSEAWNQEQAERDLWEATLSDGLGDR